MNPELGSLTVGLWSKKTERYCPGYILFQVFFLGFINGKNYWYSKCSCVRQLYEMKGIKFVITREMH